jgi:pimeloyl-ACP methyl ester carboxylesterase
MTNLTRSHRKPARKAGHATPSARKPRQYLRTADAAVQRRPGWKPPKTRFDIGRATLLGQFVEAAYTMYEDNPGQLTPPASTHFPAGYRPIAGVTMRDFLFGSTDPVFYGFVAQRTASPSELVMAMRGTDNNTEWWDDAQSFFMVKFRVPGCGYVAYGFDRIYNTIELVKYPSASAPNATIAERSLASEGTLAQQVAALAASDATATAGPAAPHVSVVGHSLGAALSTYYVMENAKTKKLKTPMICTFGSPRVGDATFVRVFNSLSLKSWRFAVDPDVATMVPPEAFGFRHVDALIDLNPTGKIVPSVPCWHAMRTYLSLINPALSPEASCALPPSVAARLAASRRVSVETFSTVA